MIYIDVKITTERTHNIIRIPSDKKENFIKTLEIYFASPAELKSEIKNGVFTEMYSIGKALVYFSLEFYDK